MGGLSVNEKKECWNCTYQNIPPESFLGKCLYFAQKGMNSKPIPPHVVDRGCKYWKRKKGESNKMKSKLGNIINVFDGKIIP